jgi:hypothetical protein
MSALFGRAVDPATGTALGQGFPTRTGPDGVTRPAGVAGYDLTFTPVKSVSVLWALGDAERRAAGGGGGRAQRRHRTDRGGAGGPGGVDPDRLADALDSLTETKDENRRLKETIESLTGELAQ